ncbi:putative AAA ATPase [Trypanosoma grayi]|uniref:putative AAA ATPase n=1 Tax=Trypanosoma grayi TaxID=71804 RepID=UPI0004F4629B|nr:putative AAA ATPase [Trypanosoma grayi]KEG08219.1 putative AAA ATPase [Trypanosoma grayi]
MTTAPLFALTGRGNDLKRARDLIASIGGVLTTKEQEADFLVVLKGAGRRKVEEYYRCGKKAATAPDATATAGGGGGRLLLLEMLEEWSTQGKPPLSRVSLEDVQVMNLLGAASAARGRRSYEVPEEFLKRSRVTLDPQGNEVDESDNAVLLTRQPRPLSSKCSASAAAAAATEGGGATVAVLGTRLQARLAHRALLLDDDTPPHKATGGAAITESKGNTVNPMRAAFRQRPKPEWDTYFSDGPKDSNGNNGNNHNSKSITSSRGGRVDPHAKGIAAAATPSLSLRSSTNRICPQGKTGAETALVPDITKQNKNGVEMTFDFAKGGPQRRPTVPSQIRSSSGSGGVKDAGKANMKGKEQKQHRQQSGPVDGATCTTTGPAARVERRDPRPLKKSRSDATARRPGSGLLAGDGTFGTPPPLPPRPHESASARPSTSTTNTTSTTAAPAGRATTTPGSRFAKLSSSSSANAGGGGGGGGGGAVASSSRTTGSDSLLLRVRKSAYCKGIPEETCVTVLQQVVDRACPVSFNGIAGLEVCKRILQEAIILPAKCPQLFTGLRRPCTGLLLFGPPGNGKTLLANAVAKECNTTFFSISAAAITSKWVGESEKMVRALFAVARALAPSTIFVDEIDALLQARGSQHEGEGSRRIKTEFLVQMDGAGNDTHEARVLVMGATNRPFDLDEAIIRRFPKRVLVPLPDAPAREQILRSLLNTEETPNNFTPDAWQRIVAITEGYSGHDLRQLCEEAAMIPVRELLAEKLRSGEDLTAEAYHHDLLRPLTLEDVEACVKARHPSCCPKQLTALVEWSNTYGSK